MKRLVDSWRFRAWFFWLPCAAKRHPDTFWLTSNWNFPDGKVAQRIARCSCGRRIRPETLLR